MLRGMGRLSRFNPKGGIEDFWQEFKKPQPYRIPILLVSALVPLTALYMLASERTMIPPRSPEVFYITTFEPDRTDQDIIASNVENQERKDRLQARIDEIEEKKKEAYRALGRATGLDVDAMEAEIEAEREAEEAAAATRQDAREQAATESADSKEPSQ